MYLIEWATWAWAFDSIALVGVFRPPYILWQAGKVCHAQYEVTVEVWHGRQVAYSVRFSHLLETDLDEKIQRGGYIFYVLPKCRGARVRIWVVERQTGFFRYDMLACEGDSLALLWRTRRGYALTHLSIDESEYLQLWIYGLDGWGRLDCRLYFPTEGALYLSMQELTQLLRRRNVHKVNFPLGPLAAGEYVLEVLWHSFTGPQRRRYLRFVLS
ncbi:MAG: hypothetical protein ACUVRD_05640 [Bacteroidia bacterium]